MADASTDELIDFATSLDWAQWTDDEQIRNALEEIRGRVNDIDGGDDVDLANAERIKLVVVGDSAVGKTSLLISFATDKFPDDYVPTVFENYTAQMQMASSQILLHLWDTAGQEDYDRLRPLSYPGADVVLLCFCLVSEATYEAISEKWAPEVKHYISDVPTVLVGTKVDLRDAKEADPHAEGYEPISTEKGKQLAAQIGAKCYCEVSAKSRKGLEDTFHQAVTVVLNARGTAPKPSPKGSSSTAAKQNGTSSDKKSGSSSKSSGSSSKSSGSSSKSSGSSSKSSSGSSSKSSSSSSSKSSGSSSSSSSSSSSKKPDRKGGKKKGDGEKKGNCKQS